MNREILFRGKDLETGKWLYGNFVKTPNHVYISTCGEAFPKKVEPETVGQYTGLTDKNGTKIFENDILQVNCNCHGYEIGRVCVYYKFAMYLCDTIYGDIDFDTLGMLNANYQLDVIGNVYDNPELLESECV